MTTSSKTNIEKVKKEFTDKFLVQNEDGDMEFLSDYMLDKEERNPKTGYGYYLVRDVLSFLESKLTEAEEIGRKNQREIDDRMRQAQHEYCNHENAKVCSFACQECGTIWKDKSKK